MKLKNGMFSVLLKSRLEINIQDNNWLHQFVFLQR